MEKPTPSSQFTSLAQPGRPPAKIGRKQGERLVYEPTERQQLFHASDADVVLFGGAAGGGKTRALLMEAFMQMLEIPGSHGIIFRRTFPELEKSVILESLKLFPAPSVATTRSSIAGRSLTAIAAPTPI